MKRVLVVGDIALATAKELNALGAGELGVFGIDTDGDWKPVAASTAAPQIAFAVGNGTAVPWQTPLISANVKTASLDKATYVAEVKPVARIVAGVSGFTAKTYDMTNVRVEFFDTYSADKHVLETFTIVGSYATAATIHTAIAAKINKSKYFTAVANGSGGADNVDITAPRTGKLVVSVWFENDPNESTTAKPTYTVTSQTASVEGVGTTANAQAIVDELHGENGWHETTHRYDKSEKMPVVTATRNTILTFNYAEDKPTAATRDTDYLMNQLTFIINTPSSPATTVVADLEELINQIFFGIIPEDPE